MTPLDYFLNIQGTYNHDVFIEGIGGLSADGTTMVGFASTIFGRAGFAIKSPKVVMCHKAPGNPKGKAFTIDVSFPEGLATHTNHGDTLGMCQHGGM